MMVSLPVEETKVRGRLWGISLCRRGCALLVSCGSSEQSAIRKARSSGLGTSLWLHELCSHPAIWAGADRTRLNMSVLSRPAGRSVHSTWIGVI